MKIGLRKQVLLPGCQDLSIDLRARDATFGRRHERPLPGLAAHPHARRRQRGSSLREQVPINP